MDKAARDHHGKLIAVVGPSGAGKDTLIDAARSHFAGDDRILFWQRYITREDQSGEPHIAISQEEFAQMLTSGRFFLSWQAHDLSYGIGAEILGVLRDGRNVVVNLSRRIVEDMRSKWPNSHVVLVTARPDVLISRLRNRGRENAANVDERLRRGSDIILTASDNVTELDNSGALVDSIARFNALLAQLTAK